MKPEKAKQAQDAGAPEVVITDNMTLVGAIAMAECDPRVEDEREIVSRIFRAMAAASPRQTIGFFRGLPVEA